MTTYNRLLKADFTDNKPYDFSVKIGDGVNAQTAYDANGNILSMKQRGLKAGGNATIDSLTYGYVTNSNKLNIVNDASNDEQSTLGDFHYAISTKSAQDYTYDGNGSLITDKNKNIDSIIYNELNLPQAIYVKNKGSIFNVYDASGMKLKKVAADNSVAGKTITTITNYIGEFVYQTKTTTPTTDQSDYFDSLQVITQDEGRIRKVDTGMYVYDYFVKDHLGNVRMVLTEQKDTIKLPSATVEPTTLATEKKFYTINDGQVIDTSLVNGSRAYPQFQSKVYKINGSTDGSKTGLGLVLKVMAGDKVTFSVQSIYTATGSLSNPATATITDLLSSFLGSGALGGKGLTVTALDAMSPGAMTAFQNQHSEASDRPKAYLNYLLFDDQFRYIAGDLDPVNSCTVNTPSYKLHNKFVTTPINVTKNGYIYIYVSNESNLNVFFDNLTVTHFPGAIQEETHYYPFGLVMAGISSKAGVIISNKYKFNEATERNESFDLSLDETLFRLYDPQVGRFLANDPFAEAAESSSPYVYANNNPVLITDPLGLAGDTQQLKEIVVTAVKNTSKSPHTPDVAASVDPSKLTPGIKPDEASPNMPSTSPSNSPAYSLVKSFVNFNLDGPNSQYLLHSDCSSIQFVPVGPEDRRGATYQVAASAGVYFSWFYQFTNEKGKLEVGFNTYKFNVLYFEFPRLRIGSSNPITSGTAATIVAQLIDYLNASLEGSSLGARDPVAYANQNESYLLNNLRDALKVYGGRVTKESNYGIIPAKPFRKSVIQNVCN